ncbi:hypothetical protein PUR29_36930 [Methylobacterium ajmalii]|uniref:Zinc finger CHC2-type domain-containing protein n=1 Tax=Methylobacterium ajmalii TaxID=2738439 RepID=A0ABV0A7A6_9HYPH
MSRAPRRPGERRTVAIARIAEHALGSAPAILARWLPDGRRQGAEWVARNPTRSDARPGSFKVNTVTGRWADFSTGERGGDLVSLAAYLFKTNQVEAASGIAEMLGVSAYD